MLLTQIPNPRYTQIRKSGIYLLANSHSNLSRPCLTSCTSSYRSLDCSESSAPLSPRNPSRPKRYKQTRALQTRSVGQQLPSATTGPKLIATIATSVRQTQLQAPKRLSTIHPASRAGLTTASRPSPDAPLRAPEHGVSIRTRVSFALQDRGVERGVKLNILDAVHFLVLRESPSNHTPPRSRLVLSTMYTVERRLGLGLEY